MVKLCNPKGGAESAPPREISSLQYAVENRVKINKHNKKELLLGKEKEKREEEEITRTCASCDGSDRPTFSTEMYLLRHIILGHKFKNILEKMADKEMDNFPAPCYFCNEETPPKVKYLGNFEEAILHMGIKHHFSPVDTRRKRTINHEHLFEPEKIHMNHKRLKNDWPTIDKLTTDKEVKLQGQITSLIQKTTKNLSLPPSLS